MSFTVALNRLSLLTSVLNDTLHSTNTHSPLCLKQPMPHWHYYNKTSKPPTCWIQSQATWTCQLCQKRATPFLSYYFFSYFFFFIFFFFSSDLNFCWCHFGARPAPRTRKSFMWELVFIYVKIIHIDLWWLRGHGLWEASWCTIAGLFVPAMIPPGLPKENNPVAMVLINTQRFPSASNVHPCHSKSYHGLCYTGLGYCILTCCILAYCMLAHCILAYCMLAYCILT